MGIPSVKLQYNAHSHAQSRDSLSIPAAAEGSPRRGNLSMQDFWPTPAPPHSFAGGLWANGSCSRRYKRERPRGPIPPTTACAVADNPEMPDSEPPQAAKAPIREFARSANRYDGRPPALPPAQPDPRRAPVPASAASPAARPCAGADRKPLRKAPGRARIDERQSPLNRSRGTGPSRSAGCRSPQGRPTTPPADAAERPQFAWTFPPALWPHLPLSHFGARPGGEWRLHSTCRPIPGGGVSYRGFAMNRTSWSTLPILQITPDAPISEECIHGMARLDCSFRPPIQHQQRRFSSRAPCARGSAPRHKPPAPDSSRSEER